MGSIQCCLLILLTITAINADILKGSASIQLNGPATKEQTTEVRKAARNKLKKETLIWLNEVRGANIDSSNSLHMFHLENFLDTCINLCKEETDFRGKLLTITYVLTYSSADSAVTLFNKAADSAALASWNMLKSAHAGNNYPRIYIEGLTALFYGIGHIGAPLNSPDNPEKSLVEDVRIILQEFFDKMKVSSSNMILQGKAGQVVEQPPIVTVMIDSTPLEGIAFTGMLQNGKVLFSSETDAQGQISFQDMKIPFVQNGTMFYVSPDPGKISHSPGFISAKQFGLHLRKSQDQNFIFKVTRPIYSLEFKNTSVSQITIPPDFANASYIKKFLKDSCYMQEVSSGTPSDLIIELHSQVFKYDYDATEETSLKVTCQITVKGLSIDPPRSKQEIITFEKKYEQNIDIPYGLFFWEANVKMREALKATIENL